MPKVRRKRLTQRKNRNHLVSCRTPSRPFSKRKQWTNEQMVEAMRAVQGGMSTTRAAVEYGVPRSTLHDRISGRVLHGVKPGPKPYLHPEEESELSQFLLQCSEVGYGKTRRDVLSIVKSVAQDKGLLKKECVSHGWWSAFVRRQGNLSLRRGDSTAQVRFSAINEATIAQYFSLLKDVLDTNNLLGNPQQIYNVDESGIPLNFKTPNVVARKGAKKVRYRHAGKKGQITIVGCVNAAGQAIPPLVVFDAKKLNHTWTSGEFPGTQYGLSDSGWMTTGLFESWLNEHFLRHAVSSRPLLLLLDGHSTHYQPEVIRLARENEVIMLCLPQHSTHEAQPLDVGVFGPLKAHWTNVCHEYFQSNPGKVLSKFNFNSLFARAWMKCIQPENIINGFKKCGVYPFNPKAIKTPSSMCNNSLSSTSSNSIESGNSFPNIFTKEQLDLFERRWEEEYDIFDDAEYVQWLKLYHPETLAAKGIDANNDADQETSGDMDCTSLLQITSGITVINLAVFHNNTCSLNTGNEPAGSTLRMYEDDVYEDSLMQHFTSVQSLDPLIDSEEDSSDMEVENLATGVLSSDLSGGGLSRQSTGANGGGLSRQPTGASGGVLSRQPTGANGGGLSRQPTGASGGVLSRQSTGANGGGLSRQSTGANGGVVSCQSTGASGGVLSHQSTGANGVLSRQSTGASGGVLSHQSTGANGVLSRQSTGANGGVVSHQSTGANGVLSRQSTGANGGVLSRQSTGANGGVVSHQSTGANGVLSHQSTGTSGGVLSRQSTGTSGGVLSRQSTGANGGVVSHRSTGASGGVLSRQSTGANSVLSRQSTGANGGVLSRQSTGASGGVVSHQSTGANGVLSRQSTGASGGVVSHQSTGANGVLSRQSTGASGGVLSRQSTGANGVLSHQSTGASGGVLSRQSTGANGVLSHQSTGAGGGVLSRQSTGANGVLSHQSTGASGGVLSRQSTGANSVLSRQSTGANGGVLSSQSTGAGGVLSRQPTGANGVLSDQSTGTSGGILSHQSTGANGPTPVLRREPLTLISTENTSMQSPVTKYLNLPVPTKSKSSDSGSYPKARLLTSEESLKILVEKENKKREEIEMKERRNKEREEKKKLREAEAKRKAEERAKKSAERARKAEEKASEKTRKLEERARKAEEKAAERARKAGGKVQVTSNSKAASETRQRASRQRATNTLPVRSEDIDSNVCCTCFHTYEEDVALETGTEWLKCACGRWLHEVCVDGSPIADENGNDRLCPLCLDILVN